MLSVLLVVYILMFIRYRLLTNRYGVFRSSDRRKFENVQKRLRSYAVMKGTYRESEGQPDPRLLTSAEHEVLLGILKKVEAKNASLALIWTFLAIFLVGFISLWDDRYDSLATATLAWLVLPFVFLGIRGMVQVDQIDADRLIERLDDPAMLTKQMQDALMRDLLIKEICYRLSYRGSQVVALLFFLVSVVYSIFWFLNYVAELRATSGI